MKIRPDWHFIFHLFHLSTPLLIPAGREQRKGVSVETKIILVKEDVNTVSVIKHYNKNYTTKNE